jgi:hypothetical protein
VAKAGAECLDDGFLGCKARGQVLVGITPGFRIGQFARRVNFIQEISAPFLTDLFEPLDLDDVDAYGVLTHGQASTFL